MREKTKKTLGKRVYFSNGHVCMYQYLGGPYVPTRYVPRYLDTFACIHICTYVDIRIVSGILQPRLASRSGGRRRRRRRCRPGVSSTLAEVVEAAPSCPYPVHEASLHAALAYPATLPASLVVARGQICTYMTSTGTTCIHTYVLRTYNAWDPSAWARDGMGMDDGRWTEQVASCRAVCSSSYFVLLLPTMCDRWRRVDTEIWLRTVPAI